MKSPKRTCCRATPRCRDCPVRLAALQRRAPGEPTAASLVEEILRGTGPRQMPASVVQALAVLDGGSQGPHAR